MHLRVGVHRAFALDGHPSGLAAHAPGAGGGGRIAQQLALAALLQVETVLGAVLEVRDVLAVELVEPQTHSEIVGCDGHGSIAPHDHRRPGARIGPAEVRGHLAVLHLPTAPFLVVVGVPAPAVRADGAAVVDVVAQLAYVFDHHVHAVRVALAQMAAAGVVGAPAPEPDGAVAHVLAAFALPAEAVV